MELVVVDGIRIELEGHLQRRTELLAEDTTGGDYARARPKLIEAQLADIQKTLPPGIKADQIQFRQATFIETSIDNVKTVLVEAAIVVAVILILFLMNVRATLIALTAIPSRSSSRCSSSSPSD